MVGTSGSRRTSPQWRVAAISYVGRRAKNEDAILLREGASSVLAVVADGMGGHVGGQEASRIVIDTLRSRVDVEGPVEGLRLDAYVRAADRAIRDRASANPSLAEMGSTVVALLWSPTSFVWCWCGDSRLYLVRPDEIRQITVDHTAVQEAVDRAELSSEDAGESPFKGMLIRSLGGGGDSEPDFGESSEPPEAPEIYLLSSDGLHGLLSSKEISTILQTTPSLQEGIETLAREAFRKGSTDNISIIALEFGNFPRAPDSRWKALAPVPDIDRSSAISGSLPRPSQTVSAPRRRPWWKTTVGKGVLVGCGLVVMVVVSFLVGRSKSEQPQPPVNEPGQEIVEVAPTVESPSEVEEGKLPDEAPTTAGLPRSATPSSRETAAGREAPNLGKPTAGPIASKTPGSSVSSSGSTVLPNEPKKGKGLDTSLSTGADGISLSDSKQLTEFLGRGETPVPEKSRAGGREAVKEGGEKAVAPSRPLVLSAARLRWNQDYKRFEVRGKFPSATDRGGKGRILAEIDTQGGQRVVAFQKTTIVEAERGGLVYLPGVYSPKGSPALEDACEKGCTAKLTWESRE
jgi:protein phosphatase